MTGHHDDFGFRLLLLYLREQFDAIRAGEFDVEEHHVNGLGLKNADGLQSDIRDMHLKTHAVRHFLAAITDPALIVHDQ